MIEINLINHLLDQNLIKFEILTIHEIYCYRIQIMLFQLNVVLFFRI